MTGSAYRIELDISADFGDHETFVIIDALTEYAADHRWRADDGNNAEFMTELADAADRLRERIEAQMVGANLVELPGARLRRCSEPSQ